MRRPLRNPGSALGLSLCFLLAACSANDGGGGQGGAGAGGSGGLAIGGSGGSLNVGGGGSGGAAGSSGGTTGVCDQAVDIVFVMDVSTSMGAFLSKLAGEIEAVDKAVQTLNLKQPPHYGLVVFVDDTLFANSSQPYSDVAALKTDFQSWASFTSSNQQTAGETPTRPTRRTASTVCIAQRRSSPGGRSRARCAS
ncbi:MAG: VWA domain-containing protein [Myxococcales bacterium]|nr:VWA domain-containing protein [Myxococcales bacterium]